MGVDHCLSFGYGFFIFPEKRTLEFWDDLDYFLDDINNVYKTAITHQEDGYYDSEIFIVSERHNTYDNYNNQISNENLINFQVKENELLALNKIRERYLPSEVNEDDKMGWYTFTYQR